MQEEWRRWRQLIEQLYLPSRAMRADYFDRARLFSLPDDSWLLVAATNYGADLLNRYHDAISRLLNAHLRRPVQLVIRSKEQAHGPAIVQTAGSRAGGTHV